MARSILVAAVCLASAAFASPKPARAQSSDDDQAHAHFQVAASYYEQANYDSALREFLEAYRLSQRSQLFYNLSLCYQQLGDLQNATDYLSRYLHDITEIPNRASLETRLENLRTRLAAQHAGTTPPPETPEPTATTTSVATTTTTTVTPPPPSTPPPPPASSGGGDSLNIGAIVGFSVAGVGLIGGAIFSGLAASEDSRVSGLTCAATRTCTDGDVSTMRTDALLADVMWAVSLAGASVGLVFLLVNPGGHASSESAHANLRFAPGALLLEGAF